MGVEGVGSKLAHSTLINGTDKDSSLKENKVSNKGMVLNEPITFGSHGADAPVKGEVNKASAASLPKDAVDEWPEPKQILHFYFVKYRSYEDPKIKEKLDLADKELKKKNEARSQLIEKLRAKRAERSQVITQKQPLGAESKQFKIILEEKRKEIEPLQEKLGQWRGTMGGGREKGGGFCSSEEELDAHIKSLEYRIQHESISLNEEKKILREIKQLEGTREKVIANAAARVKLFETVAEKDALQDQVKLMGVDLVGVKKDRQAVQDKFKQLDDVQKAIEKQIKPIEEELTALTQKRDKTFEGIKELWRQRDEGNSPFFENRTLLNKARQLAARKDTKILAALSENEVEKFITLWCANKKFRDDYEKRILPSLDIRQLSRDGRMRNPDEKPLIERATPAPTVTAATPKTNSKQPKEDAVSALQKEAPSTEKVQKEKNNKEQQKEAKNKKKEIPWEQNDLEDGEKTSKLEIPPRNPPKIEVDEKKLKEMRREEEIAKNRQALERKKKLAEKAAQKAAIKAQKEAEKKLKKELEKKAKKKAGASNAAPDPEEPTETEEKVTGPEKVEEKVVAPVPTKNKVLKENVVRSRPRPRGTDSLPKAILKRKKARNYWLWAAGGFAVFLALLAIGYNYLH